MISLTIFWAFFIIVLVLDFLIKGFYLGFRINKFYLKFLELDLLSRNILIFTVCFLMFYFLGFLLGLLDISLFNFFDIDPYKIKIFKNLGEDGLINNDVFSNVNSTNNSSTSVGTSTQTLDLSNSINHNKTDNVDNVGSIATTVKDNNLNLNLSNLNLKVPVEGLHSMAAAVSATGGASIGYQIVKNMPGTPLVKAAAGVSAMLATQATTVIVTKALNINNKSDTTNFIGNIISNRTILEDKYPDFPLNLLPEISQLVDAELISILILFNITISKLIMKIDFSKYLPNNKLGLILEKVINRYIKIWNLNSNILIGINCVIICFCIIVIKLSMYLIINN